MIKLGQPFHTYKVGFRTSLSNIVAHWMSSLVFMSADFQLSNQPDETTENEGMELCVSGLSK